MQWEKHAWFLKGTHFLLVADNGEVPAALLRALLGPDRMASRIRGQWDLDVNKGQLVLTNVEADGKPGLKEVRLGISPAGAVRVNLENGGQYNLISFAEKLHVPERGETYPIYDVAQRIDHEFLQGTWSLDVRNVDSKAVAPDSPRWNSIVLKGNDWTAVSQGTASKGTFRLDSVPTPGTVDVTFVEDSEKGNTYLGIYELRGDTLKLCRVPVGKERPAAFARKSGNEVLETYRRAAAGAVGH